MRRALAPALALVLLGTGGAGAQPLSGADLVREISDNTLVGFNGSLWFSEFHAPDGRVFGQNGGAPNQDACWKVRGDAVCYYYPKDGRNAQGGTSEFCWRLERAGSAGYRITSLGLGGGGIARLEPGNPRGHSDNGRAWTCEPLLSRREPHRALPSYAAALGLARPARALVAPARWP